MCILAHFLVNISLQRRFVDPGDSVAKAVWELPDQSQQGHERHR